MKRAFMLNLYPFGPMQPGNRMLITWANIIIFSLQIKVYVVFQLQSLPNKLS